MHAIRRFQNLAVRSNNIGGLAREPARYATSASDMLRSAEAHLDAATEGLRAAALHDRRGERALSLVALAASLAPQADHLRHLFIAQPLAPEDPLRDLVHRRLVTAGHVQAMVTAGATLLRAYAPSQFAEEAPILDDKWTRRLFGEARNFLHLLAADPGQPARTRAVLLAASTPECLLPLIGVEDLPTDVRLEAGRWRLRHAPQALRVPEWLALRLLAHPDSGAAIALRTLEHLRWLDADLMMACGALLSELAQLQGRALATAAGLPGLGLADPLANYHLALPSETLPHLASVLREGGEWLIGGALSTSRSQETVQRELGLGDPPSDRLLCLQSPSVMAGPVRGLRFDIFHPPETAPRDEVLLMPGQRFRVCELGVASITREGGGPLTVKHFRLDKEGEVAGTKVPGALQPGRDPVLRAWSLASEL
jgi:hypothetical protein